MNDQKIAVLDLETTGLNPRKHDRIVEIGIVVLGLDGTVHAEYETLVNPRRDIGPTSIHGIMSGDVLNAPVFEDVAGDLLSFLRQADVIAGHNLQFDINFLFSEFARLNIQFPQIPFVCTCTLMGRQNLQVCCQELGITASGRLHSALDDARAASQVMLMLSQCDLNIVAECQLDGVDWPNLPALRTQPLRRIDLERREQKEPRFLQRIASKMRHDVEAKEPSLLAYLTLIDRVLEDRQIDAEEEQILVDAAIRWNISQVQLDAVHREYLRALAVHALDDGIVTEAERRDLQRVALLLGQDTSQIERLLDDAAAQLKLIRGATITHGFHDGFSGKRVCFTGQLQSTLNGQAITRDMAQRMAESIGMLAVGGVTKNLDVLVMADPDSQSTKATIARRYGTRILAEPAFWTLTGIHVD